MTPIEFSDREYGITEITGKDHNPRILEYLSVTTLGRDLKNQDETSWCAAHVNWCLGAAGIPGTGSAMARSFMDWGKPCAPAYGCVVVLWRKAKNSPWGHVGLFKALRNGKLYLQSGNQGNMVCTSAYPEGRLLGYRTWL